MAKLDRNDGTVLTLGTVAALAAAGVWRYRMIPDPPGRGSSNHLVKGEHAKWSQGYIDSVTSAPKESNWRMSRSEAQKARMTVTAVFENSYNVRDLHTGQEASVADWMLVAGDSKTRKWPGTGYQGVKPSWPLKTKGSRAKSQTDRQRAIKAFVGAVRLGDEHISPAQARRLTKGHDVAEINEAALAIRLARTSHAPGGLGLEDPKGSKSFGLPSVLVKFKNPRDNYTTPVSASTTQQKARKYFVGKRFDMGSYPQERLEEVIDIEFMPASQPVITRLAYKRAGSSNTSDILQGDFATFDDFSKEVRRVRLRNKNKWWGANATVAGRHVTIKAFGNDLSSGRYRVDDTGDRDHLAHHGALSDWTPGYGDESVRHFNQSLAEPFKKGSGSQNDGHREDWVLVEMLGGQKAVGAAIRHVAKSDPSGTNLEVFRQVMEVLESKLELNDNEMQAVKRLQMIVRNRPNPGYPDGMWPGLLTNNLFKAANLLGLELPHHMF